MWNVLHVRADRLWHVLHSMKTHVEADDKRVSSPRLNARTKRLYILKPAAESLFKYVWPFSGHQVLKG